MPDSVEVVEAKRNKDNREFFVEVVKKNPLLIEWANDEIRNDKMILLDAVKVDGGALEFASNNLKDDKDVLLAAVSQSRLDSLLCK